MDPTRRQVLHAAGAGVALACSGSARAERSKGDALDEALHRIHRREPDSVNGLSTHAPMVAEVLDAHGRADRIAAWLDGYRGTTRQLPRATRRIDPARWRDALGPDVAASSWERANPRWADWVELFTAELAARSWREVLDRWVGRLAPGLVGAATHGVIRTSHAARAMARRDTPERRAELARGLAYWASSYEELAGRGPAVASLDKVPRYWDATGHRPGGSSITDGLRHVKELDAFPAKVEIAGDLSALTARFAQAFLDHGTRHDAIAFVHAVTGPCSLRRLAPCIQPATARAAMPHAWRAAAMIYAMYARPGDARREARPTLSRDELVARAIDGGDEHAIKFTETALGEHALDPNPVYLAAAESAIAQL
ncbi:MAG TPA: hypothetical protein VGD80_28710 [Kofleriaceae bacterium]